MPRTFKNYITMTIKFITDKSKAKQVNNHVVNTATVTM